MTIDSEKGFIMLTGTTFNPPIFNIQTYSTVLVDDNGMEKDVNYHRVITEDDYQVIWFDNNMQKVDDIDKKTLEEMYLKRLKKRK